jgi:hypothetical protein
MTHPHPDVRHAKNPASRRTARHRALRVVQAHPYRSASVASLAVVALTAALTVSSPSEPGQASALRLNRSSAAQATSASAASAQASSATTPTSRPSSAPVAPVKTAPATGGSTSGSTSGGSSVAQAYVSAGKTLFGASLDMNGSSFSSALASQDSKYGHLGVMRVFYPGMPASFASHPQLLTRPSVISFKVPSTTVLSGKDDAFFKSWFASAPKTTDVYWSYWHEPENDGLNLANYRAAWAHLANIAHSVGNPHLHATLILMEWSLHPGSHRNWKDYYAGSQYIDDLGWDVYNTGVRNTHTYKTPEKLLSFPAAASKSVGKPWGVAELGSLMASGDSGSGEAAWLAACTSYLIANHAMFASYFDENMPGGDYRLRAAAPISTWRASVAKS